MIRKAYVELPWGRVHYRIAGHGPPVVLLHDSPRSSALHEPLLEALGPEHTVLALDTPGYGLSSPLPEDPIPGIGEFADGLAATLDALSLPACPIYGYHTSSKIALEFAVRHPRRASLIVMDGLSVPDGPVSEDFIERYMAPFRVSDDGSYLTTIWARVRDLHRFFPWFSHTAANRLSMELPGPEVLHRYALDLLQAGTHYASAYAAAMRYDPLPAIRQLQTPAVVICRRNDVLFPHLASLPDPLPDGVIAEALPADSNVWRARLSELFARYSESHRMPSPPDGLAAAGGAAKFAYAVDSRGSQLHLRMAGSAADRLPVLILPELPGVAATAAPLQDALAADRRTLTLDPPGSGESDGADDPSPISVAAELLRILESLDWQQADVVATFTSAPIALEMARQGGERIRRLVLDGLVVADEAEREEIAADFCPSLAPAWDGRHLVAAWTMLRDRELNWPWYARDTGSIRKRTPDLDPWWLHQQATGILRQPTRYMEPAEAALRYDVRAMLSDLEQPMLLICNPDDVRDRGTRRAAEFCGGAILAETDAGAHGKASIIRSFLS